MKLRFGIVAHDEKKQELLAWARSQSARLRSVKIFATGQTGRLLKKNHPGFDVTRLKSGPLGGDQQLGAMIAEQELDILIFFIDPLSPHPHDVDVKALIRLATLYDLAFACNRKTADHMLVSLWKDRQDEHVAT